MTRFAISSASSPLFAAPKRSMREPGFGSKRRFHVGP
jgi:hypothetical protein